MIFEALMEFCPRCGHRLIELHQSLYCERCKWKEGCCEGEPENE